MSAGRVSYPFEYKQVSKTKDRQRVSPGARTTITIMQLQVRNHQEIIWVSHVPCRAIYSTASSKQEYMPESEKSGHSRSRRPKHPARMSCCCCCCASQSVDRCRDDVVRAQRDRGRGLACLLASSWTKKPTCRRTTEYLAAVCPLFSLVTSARLFRLTVWQ